MLNLSGIRHDIRSIIRQSYVKFYIGHGQIPERLCSLDRMSWSAETFWRFISIFPDSIRLISSRFSMTPYKRSESSRAAVKRSACLGVSDPIFSSNRICKAIRTEVSGVLS